MLELRPFQVATVKEMLNFLTTGEAHAVYNASEMGLGKSIETIATLESLNFKKVLIICPAVMRLVWRDEINKWAKHTHNIFVIANGADSKKSFMHTAEWVIVSYDLAAKEAITAKLLAKEFECIVLDESHMVKTSRAKRTKAVLKTLWPKIPYRIALSGTPFTSSVMDGYTLFSRMLPSAFTGWADFANRYSYSRPTPWGMKYYGVKNHEELSKIIRKYFYVRYTKDEVLTELPDKTYQRVALGYEYLLKVPKTEAEKLKQQMEVLQAAVQRGETLPVISDAIASQRRLQAELKVPAIVEFVVDKLEQEIPIVVFSWHTSVLMNLYQALAKYNPAVIYGATAQAKRMEEIKRFQSGETNLFIGNMAAAGVGITLTRASTVVLAELDWSPSVISQAVDRCHRIGQKDAVTVYYFVVNDSLEESIIETVMQKVEAFNKVLD